MSYASMKEEIIRFELLRFQLNPISLPWYRKESPMTELDRIILSLKVLQTGSPQTVIFLPPCTHGLPVGSYNLSFLFECIILNLQGEKPNCLKGVPHGKTVPKTC